MNFEKISMEDTDSAAPHESSARDGVIDRLPAAARHGVRFVTSAELFAAHREVQIEHHGSVYRLKQTSLGKLILTK